MMEAYASIYEKKGDCVDKKDKGMHNCAKKVCHEEYGEGETIFGQHAVPDENGFVSHYDVEFEHVIVENVPVEELEIITESSHPTAEGHRYEGEMISEEEVDVFDIIKGYLIDEGYADSEESALAIMANMTEEQRTQIISEADKDYAHIGIVGPPKRKIDKIPGVRNLRIGINNALKRSDYGYNDEIRQVGKHVIPTPRQRPGSVWGKPGTVYTDISGDSKGPGQSKMY